MGAWNGLLGIITSEMHFFSFFVTAFLPFDPEHRAPIFDTT